MIREHRETANHRRNVNREAANNGYNGFVINDREDIINRKVQRARIKLSAVFAEHNLAFLLAEHLIPVIKYISFDEDCREIWERLSLSRLDVPQILKNCIAKSYRAELAEKLRNSKCSIQMKRLIYRKYIMHV